MRRALLIALLVACSDYRRGVEPDAASPLEASVDASIDAPVDAGADAPRDAHFARFDCEAFCARTFSVCGTPAAMACFTRCTSETARIPIACMPEVDALLACVRTAQVRCATGVNIPYLGCDAPYDALSRCVARG